jgi:hypothetical protein
LPVLGVVYNNVAQKTQTCNSVERNLQTVLFAVLVGGGGGGGGGDVISSGNAVVSGGDFDVISAGVVDVNGGDVPVEEFAEQSVTDDGVG